MGAVSFIDFYILDQNDPTFMSDSIIEDEIISVIVQKYKTIIFTNKGELLGDPDFGADLLLLLQETKVSSDYVQGEILSQIQTYIPELIGTNFTLDVLFTQDPYNYQDIMFINFNIADYQIYARIGNLYGGI